MTTVSGIFTRYLDIKLVIRLTNGWYEMDSFKCCGVLIVSNPLWLRFWECITLLNINKTLYFAKFHILLGFYIRRPLILAAKAVTRQCLGMLSGHVIKIAATYCAKGSILSSEYYTDIPTLFTVHYNRSQYTAIRDRLATQFSWCLVQLHQCCRNSLGPSWICRETHCNCIWMLKLGWSLLT